MTNRPEIWQAGFGGRMSADLNAKLLNWRENSVCPTLHLLMFGFDNHRFASDVGNGQFGF